MSWEDIIKNEQEWELREQKQRREDKAASYDKPPKKHWRKKRDSDKRCFVRKCSALKCKYNHKARCTLPDIDLDSNAKCMDYTPITDYPQEKSPQEKRPPERIRHDYIYDGSGSPMDLMRRGNKKD